MREKFSLCLTLSCFKYKTITFYLLSSFFPVCSEDYWAVCSPRQKQTNRKTPLAVMEHEEHKQITPRPPWGQATPISFLFLLSLDLFSTLSAWQTSLTQLLSFSTFASYSGFSLKPCSPSRPCWWSSQISLFCDLWQVRHSPGKWGYLLTLPAHGVCCR